MKIHVPDESPNEMDVSDEYIRGERECNTFTLLSLYLQKKKCFRQLYLSRTRVNYIFRPFTLSPNQNMFPAIIFELNESEIHFPSFIQPPNKNTLPINISEAEENEMYIPSFHLSPNENVCV